MSLHFHVIPVTPFAQNCSILWCDATRRAAVVDAGGDIERIADWVSRQNLTVEKLLLTHGHIDHAGGAARLAEQLGVKIEGPQRGKLLAGPAAATRPYVRLSAQRGADAGSLAGGRRQRQRGRGNAERDSLPRPYPGHVVFHSAGARLLIAGDVLFQGSIGRTDFPMGNHQQLIDAIQQKLFLLPDDTTVVPGHGP